MAIGMSTTLQPIGDKYQLPNGGTAQDFRFSKKLLPSGVYMNVDGGWVKDFSPSFNKSAYQSTKKFLESGYKSVFQTDHDWSHPPQKTLGYLKDVEIDEQGDISGILNIRGDDNIKMAQTVDYVSVGIDPRFVDGTGKVWKNLIRHVALTSDPIVPHDEQGGFRIAASRFIFQSPMKEFDMELLEKLQAAKIVGSDVDQAALADTLTSKYLALSATIQEQTRQLQSAQEDLKTTKDSLEKLKTELDDNKKALTLSNSKVVTYEAERKVDPDMLELSATTYEAGFDQLRSEGELTPYECAALKEILIGPENNRNVYCLSNGPVADGRKTALVREILDMLRNRPKLGLFKEKSKSQQLPKLDEDSLAKEIAANLNNSKDRVL
jgi:hypothetical protein